MLILYVIKHTQIRNEKEWDKQIVFTSHPGDYLQSLRLTGVNTLKRRYRGCAKQHSRGRSLYSWEKNTKKQTQKFKGNLSHSNSSAKTVWFAMIPMYIGWSPKSECKSLSLMALNQQTVICFRRHQNIYFWKF